MDRHKTTEKNGEEVLALEPDDGAGSISAFDDGIDSIEFLLQAFDSDKVDLQRVSEPAGPKHRVSVAHA